MGQRRIHQCDCRSAVKFNKGHAGNRLRINCRWVAKPVSLPRHQFGTKPCGFTVKFGKITCHMGGICGGKGDKAQQAVAD